MGFFVIVPLDAFLFFWGIGATTGWHGRWQMRDREEDKRLELALALGPLTRRPSF